MQGWVWVRGARGRLDRMYAMIKQRSLLYNATTALDRSDPGLKQVFLEGASARVLHNNAAMGEFEFEVSVGEDTLVLRVESEAQETNWIAWVNLASSEEAWRDTLSKMFVPEKNDKEEEEGKAAKAAEEETSVFRKSKVGVLRESGEWDGYNKNEQIMIEYMSRLIDTYLETVKKNLMDSLPKVGCNRASASVVHHAVSAQPHRGERVQCAYLQYLQPKPRPQSDGGDGLGGEIIPRRTRR